MLGGNPTLKKLVYVVSGGVSRHAERRPDVPFSTLIKEAYEYALGCLGVSLQDGADLIDGAVASYAPRSRCQANQAAAVMEHLGLFPKSVIQINQEDVTGGTCFQEAVRRIELHDMDICLAYGWEANHESAHNEPDSVVYHETHTLHATLEQMAKVCVKNHRNAAHNPYAHRGGMIDLGNGEHVTAAQLTVEDVRRSEPIAGPLTRLDVYDTISNSAAVCLLASETGLRRLRKAGAKLKRMVFVSGMGCAHTCADSDQQDGFHNPAQIAAHMAYASARITYPLWELDFVEMHDFDTSYEIKTYEDMGFCDTGKGGAFVDNGFPFLNTVDYGKACRQYTKRRVIAVNPSGGLNACGHSGVATALRQTVFSLWQIQGTIREHFGSDLLQVPDARRGAVHSHAETGDMVTVSILER